MGKFQEIVEVIDIKNIDRNMKNRVHYGEFTLDYWLEQLISGGIVLPEYQRSFVWSKEQIINLIKSVDRDELWM